MRHKRRRIAVYGGSFDPVHNGHLAIARQLTALFGLDEFWLMPAHVAPHKRGADVTPAIHRYAMLALATQNDARLIVSTLELEAPEMPYTVETLARLAHAESLRDARLLFVMGADSWAEITTWREWEQLLTMVEHVVVTRPGVALHVDHVGAEIANRVADLRGSGAAEVDQVIEEQQAPRIYFTDAVMMNVSSTAVRLAARAGRHDELRSMVAPGVAEYVEKYKLYQVEKEIRIADVERTGAH